MKHGWSVLLWTDSQIPESQKGWSNMQFKNPLLVVADMERSVAFYGQVLGLQKIMDFGANVTLTGGVCLQTRETWAEFIDVPPDALGWCGKVSELYFEEDEFDAFAQKLQSLDIHYVHPVKEHAWGQRVVRFYDPDGHIIEVGENMNTVCKRFLDSGMTPEQAARRMDVPVEYINACIRGELEKP